MSKLEDAGNSDQCPDCGTQFKCPGEDYLAALTRDKELDAAERREKKEQAAKAKAERKAERLAERERIRAEKEQQKADFDQMAFKKNELPPHMKNFMSGFSGLAPDGGGTRSAASDRTDCAKRKHFL